MEKSKTRSKSWTETVTTLSNAKEKLAELKREHSHMKDVVGDDVEKQAAKMQANIMSTYHKMVEVSFEPLLPSLSDKQRDVLQESGFNELTENS